MDSNNLDEDLEGVCQEELLPGMDAILELEYELFMEELIQDIRKLNKKPKRHQDDVICSRIEIVLEIEMIPLPEELNIELNEDDVTDIL